MSKYPTFYSTPVQQVRFDGHASNAFIPTGNHISFTSGVAWVQTYNPPPEAVAMFINIVGNVKYTLDGFTIADAAGNVGLNFTGSIVYIRPGFPLSVSGVASAVVNLQWLGSV